MSPWFETTPPASQLRVCHRTHAAVRGNPFRQAIIDERSAEYTLQAGQRHESDAAPNVMVKVVNGRVPARFSEFSAKW